MARESAITEAKRWSDEEDDEEAMSDKEEMGDLSEEDETSDEEMSEEDETEVAAENEVATERGASIEEPSSKDGHGMFEGRKVCATTSIIAVHRLNNINQVLPYCPPHLRDDNTGDHNSHVKATRYVQQPHTIAIHRLTSSSSQAICVCEKGIHIQMN